MYCNKCGSKFEDTSQRFCKNCGSDIFKDGYSNVPIKPEGVVNTAQVATPVAPQSVQTPIAPQPVQRPVQTPVQSAGQAMATNVGAAHGQVPSYNNPAAQGYNNPAQTAYTAPVQPPLSMKWHNWLVKFSLVFGAILSIGLGVATIMGLIYAGEADLVYGEMPMLQMVDIVYGALLFVLAILEFYSWSRLRKFRKNGPSVLLMTLVFSDVLSFVYVVAAMVIIGDYAGAEFTVDLGAEAGRSVVIGIVYCIGNYTYYKKRKHLFVN